ncbi:ankyrin repeat-containing domain protein [Thelonectria olida]|uniref:Ankyrin repeat-containing domain protein n=1 Tax=Thelonectria olida TaxID=1576542 RepID=A0A9P8VRJ2_9HYPO|nr:ankyrin repeat-containing domain protein [Thelonectria olida]
MAVDWSLYEPDIKKLYVKEKKTAEETLRLLNSKHGTRITLRQFKFKFGGLKNLKAKEWRVICHEVAKRKAQDIQSEVYFNGRRQSREQLERAFRLYSSNASSDAIASTDLGIDTVGQHRIEIRCPTAQNTAVPAEAFPEDLAVALDAPQDVPSNDVLMPMETTNDSFPEFDIEDQTFDLSTPRVHTPSLPLFLCSTDLLSTGVMIQSPPALPSPVRCTEATTWSHHGKTRLHNQQTGPSRFQALSPIQGFDFNCSLGNIDFSFPKCSYDLFWDSPVVSSILQNLGCGTKTSTGHQLQIRHLATTPSLVPRGQEGWLSSFMISVDPRLQSMQPMAKLTEYLLSDPRLHRTDEIQFDIKNPKLLHYFLLITTYLASNNLLHHRLEHFVRLVFASGNTEDFTKTLMMFSCKADLIPALLRALCWRHGSFFMPQINDPEGQFFDLLQRYPSESLLLLKMAARRDLAGNLGWNLLKTAALSNHLEAAKLLVERGVTVDKPGFNMALSQVGFDQNVTPLAMAAFHGSFDVLKFLINSGSDVNKRFSSHRPGERTALSMAAEGGQAQSVQLLLEAEAKVDLNLTVHEGNARNILDYSRQEWPDIHSLLLRHLSSDEETSIWLLIQAARKGIRPLADFLVQNGRMDDEFLEQGLYYAIKWVDSAAVVAFLCRGVDANAQKYRLAVGEDVPHPLALALSFCDKEMSDMVYLLAQSGATLDVKDAQAAVSRWSELHFSGDQDRELSICLTSLACAGHPMSILGPMALELAASIGPNPIVDCGTLLGAECAINSYGVRGMNALQAAAECGDLALIQYLVYRGADINFPASENEKCGGRTALQAAAERGNDEVVEYLLQAGADIHAPPGKGSGITVLEGAAKAIARVDFAAKRLNTEAGTRNSRKKKVQLNLKRLVACVATFKTLLALGAPVNRTNGESGELLHSLITAGHTECLELVLQKDAALETAVELFHGRVPVIGNFLLTPLQLAANLSHMEAMRLLIGNGACVNAPASSSMGLTALQAATSDSYISNFWETCGSNLLRVQLLLQHDANVNAPPSHEGGRTALQAACFHQNPNVEVIKLLLSRGANVNAAPAPVRGVTALQGAAIQGHIHLVRLLFEHHADVNAPGAPEEGRTAVEGAAEHGRSDIVRLLLNEGAQPDLATGFSRAVQLARDNEHWHIVDLLEDHQRHCGLEPVTNNLPEPFIEDGMDLGFFS